MACKVANVCRVHMPTCIIILFAQNQQNMSMVAWCIVTGTPPHPHTHTHCQFAFATSTYRANEYSLIQFAVWIKNSWHRSPLLICGGRSSEILGCGKCHIQPLADLSPSADRRVIRIPPGQLTDQWRWAERSELRHCLLQLLQLCKTNIWLRRRRKAFMLFINTFVDRNCLDFDFVAVWEIFSIVSVTPDARV